MLNGINRASPSAWTRKDSLIESVLVYAVLILLILAPSVFTGLHSGVLAFVASAWATVLTMGATFHYRLRKI